MRHLTEAHLLYPIFLARLSQCIFEWDSNNVARLKKAKTAEMGCAWNKQHHRRHGPVRNWQARAGPSLPSAHSRRQTNHEVGGRPPHLLLRARWCRYGRNAFAGQGKDPSRLGIAKETRCLHLRSRRRAALSTDWQVEQRGR